MKMDEPQRYNQHLFCGLVNWHDFKQPKCRSDSMYGTYMGTIFFKAITIAVNRGIPSVYSPSEYIPCLIPYCPFNTAILDCLIPI